MQQKNDNYLLSDENLRLPCPCEGSNFGKMLQPAILLCLYRQELHGFLLIKELAKITMFHGTEPDKAGVYRYVKKMEESGLLQSRWEMDENDGKHPRRILSITDLGRECLVKWYAALLQYSTDINSLIGEIKSEIMIKGNSG